MGEIISVPMNGQRSLATVTAEIRAYQDAARRMALNYSVEIGRRLTEAKSMVSHGEWGTYLREELGFSQSTANNHMRLFEAYGADQITMTGAAVKSQALADLSYTQALALLALPSDEEREAFVADHDMEKISTRELQAEIARLKEEAAAAEERARVAEASEDAALQERDRAKKSEDSLRSAVEALRQERKKDAGNVEKFRSQASEAGKRQIEAEKKAAALRVELDKAKKNPAVPQEVLDRIRDEAEAAALQAAQAEADKASAEKMAALQAEKETAERALLLASPEMAVFRDRFARVQEDLMALIRSVDQLPEDKQAGVWRGIAALLETARSECVWEDIE